MSWNNCTCPTLYMQDCTTASRSVRQPITYVYVHVGRICSSCNSEVVTAAWCSVARVPWMALLYSGVNNNAVCRYSLVPLTAYLAFSSSGYLPPASRTVPMSVLGSSSEAGHFIQELCCGVRLPSASKWQWRLLSCMFHHLLIVGHHSKRK